MFVIFGSLPSVYCLLPLETSTSKIYPFLTSASGDYLPVAPVLVPATGKIISGWFAIALSYPVPLLSPIMSMSVSCSVLSTLGQNRRHKKSTVINSRAHVK
jgi:hypothetical protein